MSDSNMKNDHSPARPFRDNATSTRDYAYRGYRPPRRTRTLRLVLLGVFFIIAVAASLWLTQYTLSRTNHAEHAVITQPLSLPALTPLLQNPIATVLPALKTVHVKSGDNLSTIFNRLKLSEQDLHALLQVKPYAKQLRVLHSKQTLHFQITPEHQLNQLIYDLGPGKQLVFSREDDAFTGKIVQQAIETRPTFAHAVIHNSLFIAGQKAGLSDRLIMQLANIFGWDIDFALNIRPNDSFSLLYEERYINGERIADGPILAAEFKNKDKIYRAVRYTDANNQTDYYTPKGFSLRKAFLRAPVPFTRISSHFTLGRFHPILHRFRSHKGVDYAAPRGTPVRASGDGKVTFVGRKGGYGKCIILQHGHQYSTLYAHLRHFKRGLKRNYRVKQGQIIGYVGSTGLATGPHLHYEFRINGVHHNPLTVALPKAQPIAKRYRERFMQHATAILATLKHRQALALALRKKL